jgi:hypothetical protein
MNTCEENYNKYYDYIKYEINKEGKFQKVTKVRILDRFLKKNLITEDFHKKKIQSCIKHDREEEKNDMIFSLLFSASILTFFLIVFLPEKETFTRILFGFYILIICVIALMF